MSCGVITERFDDDLDPDGGGPIMGTWDYKWPLGSKVRVAFQRPANVSPNDYAEAKGIIRDLAKTWHTERAAIWFDFDSPDVRADFDPPEQKNGSRHPQRRSPINHYDWREYDILVSLEPLPFDLVDTISGKRERVFLPFSQLGTYARRVDYGTPTMFLGPVTAVESLAAYYRTARVARTTVVHEFGHALGLAHEHQSPSFRGNLELTAADYDLERARVLLIQHFGVPEAELERPDTNAFLESHLVQTWPGNRRFSDWREYLAPELDSVMSVPYHDCSLKPATAKRLGLHVCSGTAACDRYAAALADNPTASDLAFVAQMYPVDELHEARPGR